MHMATDTDIREALLHVVDPELGVNIVDLGLVYRIDVEGGRARIAMTMTSPTCPLADYLKDLVTSAIRQRVPDVVEVDINFEWEPPWAPDMMSAEARRQLDEGKR
jgi:metal-sulfur cluster biosynthetic enzyme